MLDRLLALLKTGGARHVSELARELGTTNSLVEAMLVDLCRMGYLRQEEQGCTGCCQGCPSAKVCALGSPPAPSGPGKGRLWVLTEKAMRLPDPGDREASPRDG